MSQEDPLIGRTLLGRYRVVRRLAKGGMGVIYLARSEGAAGFVKPVVVKRILPELDERELVGMFVREAKILGNLRHPGIAGIVDFAEEDGAYLMALEYVHGYDLGRWRRYVAQARERFDFELALHIVIKVLEALQYAHTLVRPDGGRAEVVHRDISPSNVLVDTEGHVKLLDFGVARMQGDNSTYKTETFTVKGKLPYISPEQLGGEPPSPSSDVYATGVVLHELLSGKNEFRGAEAAETVARILSHVPTRISEIRDDVPPGIDEVLSRALAKRPEDRIATAEEFAEQLRELRVLNTEEAQGELLAAIRQDYAAMPAVLGLDPLDERERAWRNPVERSEGSGRAGVPSPRATSEPPTRAEPAASSSRALTASAVPPARSPAIYLAVGVVVMGLVAGGLLVASRLEPAPAEPEQVFVVQQQGPAGTQTADVAPDRGGAVGAEVRADVEPDPTTVDVDPEPDGPEETPATGSRGGRPRRAPPRGEALTATFAREGPRVSACLRDHASSIEGRPTLDVRFVLRESGEVRSIQVTPAELGATELGSCIARVARSVRFAPQDRDGVSFRIPVTVQRR